MHRYRLMLLVLSSVLIASGSLQAQLRRTSMRASDFQRAGLEVAWDSQVELDRQRSSAGGMQLQVVGRDSHANFMDTSYPVYEVTFDKGVRRFSAIDLGRDGRSIGGAEAARLAEKEKIRLEARGYQVEIQEKRVPSCTLYVTSNSGTVQAIDAENGRTQWAILVGHPKYQTLTPAANDRYVSVINGSTLYLLERLTGEQVWKRTLQQNPAWGPILTREMVFAPSINGRIEGHWLPKENARLPEPGKLPLREPTWHYQSDRRVTAPITATDTTISWPAGRGRLYVANTADPEVLYMVRAAGPIDGHSVQVPPDRLAVASTDGYVYCVNEDDGLIQWEITTGEPIRNSLFYNGGNLYAVTESGELHSISSDGFQQWVTSGIDRVLAASKSRVYARDMRGNLVGLDPKSGGKLMSMDISGYDIPVVNQLTDRIYLAASDGTITCLRETNAKLPTVHVKMPTATDADDSDTSPRRETPVSPPAENPNRPVENNDMFDDGMDDDPFGPAGDDEDPFGPAGDDEDPFGPAGDDEDPFGPAGDDEDPFGF